MKKRSEHDRAIEILVVDDSPSDREITLAALQEVGMKANISLIVDGEAAIEFLQQRGRHRFAPRPDLVFLDMELPKINGREVLRVVKNDPALRQIPIVMLSGSSSDFHVQSAYDGQVSAYIVKPLRFEEYVAAIRAVEELWFHCATLPSRH